MGKRPRWPGDFFDVAGGDGCQEDSSGWMDRIGTLDYAFGCWEKDANGLRGVRKLNCLVALMLDINLYPIVF